jgi:Uma2 family endonuclease
MTLLNPPTRFTPEDVERVGKQDAEHYELVDGELKEKVAGTESLFIAGRICDALNTHYYPEKGFAVVEAMVYCFGRPHHGRRPDVTFVWRDRLPDRKIPVGDLTIVPDLMVEVLSPGNTAYEVDDKLTEYLAVGLPLVWIVNPALRTLRTYRNDGTTAVFKSADTLSAEPRLPGFALRLADIFPL